MDNVAKVDESSFISSKRRMAFLDMLIEQHLKDPQAFSELDIREEVDTFMFEVSRTLVACKLDLYLH